MKTAAPTSLLDLLRQEIAAEAAIALHEQAAARTLAELRQELAGLRRLRQLADSGLDLALILRAERLLEFQHGPPAVRCDQDREETANALRWLVTRGGFGCLPLASGMVTFNQELTGGKAITDPADLEALAYWLTQLAAGRLNEPAPDTQ